MIKVGNTYLRNLEEQVQYLTSYHEVNQGLAQWGIRVVGKITSVTELPDPKTYEGEYGDAFAVGTEAPYDFYIWTRSSTEDDTGYWFPFGKISITGPVGPAGPQGPKGDTGKSTRWYYNTTPSNPVEGDMVLMVNGDVQMYQKTSDSTYAWVTITNIKGSQGIQGDTGPQGERGERGPEGPKGDTGDVGGFINIYGVLANTSLLPTPASLNNLTVAYLVGDASPYDLYVQIGKNSNEAVWTNTGPFNAATAVSVNGSYQNIWNADTKLDKVATTTNHNQLYTKTWNGNQTMLDVVTPTTLGYGIPTTDYISSFYAKKPTDSSDYTRVIAQNANGEATAYPIYSPSMSLPNQFGSIPTYDENINVGGSNPGATIAVDTPKYPYAAANKAYVDGIFSLNGTTLTITTG